MDSMTYLICGYVTSYESLHNSVPEGSAVFPVIKDHVYKALGQEGQEFIADWSQNSSKCIPPNSIMALGRNLSLATVTDSDDPACMNVVMGIELGCHEVGQEITKMKSPPFNTKEKVRNFLRSKSIPFNERSFGLYLVTHYW